MDQHKYNLLCALTLLLLALLTHVRAAREKPTIDSSSYLEKQACKFSLLASPCHLPATAKWSTGTLLWHPILLFLLCLNHALPWLPIHTFSGHQANLQCSRGVGSTPAHSSLANRPKAGSRHVG
jgi:hypothetical protein